MQNFLYLTIGTSIEHESMIIPGTTYTLHYEFNLLLDNTKSPKIELYEGDITYEINLKSRPLAGSGSEEFKVDPELAVGLNLKTFGVRIWHNDNTLKFGFIVLPMQGKSCRDILDAPKINLSGVTASNLNEAVKSMK